MLIDSPTLYFYVSSESYASPYLDAEMKLNVITVYKLVKDYINKVDIAANVYRHYFISFRFPFM